MAYAAKVMVKITFLPAEGTKTVKTRTLVLGGGLR